MTQLRRHQATKQLNCRVFVHVSIGTKSANKWSINARVIIENKVARFYGPQCSLLYCYVCLIFTFEFVAFYCDCKHVYLRVINLTYLLTDWLTVTENMSILPRSRLRCVDSSFSISTPTAWNNLPAHIPSCTSLSQFLSKLKSHLFITSFPSSAVSSHIVHIPCSGLILFFLFIFTFI